jgi:hypothetical protein
MMPFKFDRSPSFVPLWIWAYCVRPLALCPPLTKVQSAGRYDVPTTCGLDEGTLAALETNADGYGLNTVRLPVTPSAAATFTKCPPPRTYVLGGPDCCGEYQPTINVENAICSGGCETCSFGASCCPNQVASGPTVGGASCV